MDLSGLKVELKPMIFVDSIQPNGFLTMDNACHACWYFYLLAENARVTVGKGIESQKIEFDATRGDYQFGPDMPTWMDKRYNAQIQSIALLYGVSPESMQKFWPNVKLEANRCGLNAPADEYMNLTGKDHVT